jgi:hypothetical protein
MGTALTDDEKIQQLKDLVGEYVKHLNLWEKVDVIQVTRTKAKIPKTVRVTDDYGIESDVVQYDEVKIPPSPYVIIKYHTPKGEWKERLQHSGHESYEFPMCEIMRKINYYKYKLKTVDKC